MRSPQVPRSSPPRLSDEEVEYYGDLYVRCMIRQSGVDFESFLENPEYYLQKYAKGHPAISGNDSEKGRKGLLKYVKLRHAARTPPE